MKTAQFNNEQIKDLCEVQQIAFSHYDDVPMPDSVKVLMDRVSDLLRKANEETLPDKE